MSHELKEQNSPAPDKEQQVYDDVLSAHLGMGHPIGTAIKAAKRAITERSEISVYKSDNQG